MKNPQFNDEYDNMNDEGYDIHEEWLREEEEYWSESELDPSNEDEYDPVNEDTNRESDSDEDFDWDDEECDRDLPAGYNDWNDADNY